MHSMSFMQLYYCDWCGKLSHHAVCLSADFMSDLVFTIGTCKVVTLLSSLPPCGNFGKLSIGQNTFGVMPNMIIALHRGD